MSIVLSTPSRPASSALQLAFCRLPQHPDGTPVPEVIARAVLAHRIDTLPRTRVEAAAKARFGGFAGSDRCAECGHPIRSAIDDAARFRHTGAIIELDNDHPARLDEAFDDVPTDGQMRAVLHRAVDALYATNGNCSTVVLDGTAWVVSGGTTGNGAVPTDEYHDLHALAAAGITTDAIDSSGR